MNFLFQYENKIVNEMKTTSWKVQLEIIQLEKKEIFIFRK